MNFLGVTYGPGGHDTAAALVCDGKLAAAAEEERFTRRKHESGIPLHAIEFCLRFAGLTMRDVHGIATAEKLERTGSGSYLAQLTRTQLEELRRAGYASGRSLWHKRALDLVLGRVRVPWPRHFGLAAMRRTVRDCFGALPRILSYDHHECHAAAAYLTSPFDTAAVVTVDHNGGPYATATWRGEGGRLHCLRRDLVTNSLGKFYWDCTLYLGLGEFGEGKAMGLAAWGDANAFATQAERMLATEGDWYRYRQEPAAELLGFPARSSEPVLALHYKDFAAAMQAALERALAGVVRGATRAAGSRRLCLGGGVALNCSANGKLLATGAADSLALFPAANDAGLAVGAALLAARDAGELRREPLQNSYFGPEFAVEACVRVVRDQPGLVMSRPADLSNEVARALAKGAIVGWFQGRMEMGPRALGNRSILADPRSAVMRDRVNACKGREPWRPLAPVVVADRAADFFELRQASPFMLIATPVREEKRAAIAAVVHVDGSARPQTVARSQNPRLYDLLLAFEREAGVPVLLNTSFNGPAEPIVCTPEDAARTYLATGLDLLVLGDLLVRRR